MNTVKMFNQVILLAQKAMNFCAAPLPLVFGVLQGSGLGPVEFIAYTLPSLIDALVRGESLHPVALNYRIRN